MATRREQTSGESRAAILAAAAELFATKGYRHTTFVDVAERSGVSRGSIPWHFGSKEGLLLAVLDGSVQRIQALFEAAADPGVDLGPEQMLAGLDAWYAQPTTRLFVTLLVEALEPDSPIRDRYAAIHAVLRHQCARWLDRHTPQPGRSTEELAAAIVGAGIGLHQQWLVAPDRVDVGRSLAALHAVVTSGH